MLTNLYTLTKSPVVVSCGDTSTTVLADRQTGEVWLYNEVDWDWTEDVPIAWDDEPICSGVDPMIPVLTDRQLTERLYMYGHAAEMADDEGRLSWETVYEY